MGEPAVLTWRWLVATGRSVAIFVAPCSRAKGYGPVKKFLKRTASKLPVRLQNELKRLYFGHQIKRGSFKSDEKEFDILKKWVSEGDWVLDIGANIGQYTCMLSAIVGPAGRVVAFEPVPETFELLAANVAHLPSRNVTLLNAAASDRPNVLAVEIPKFDTGLDNYYMAHLTEEGSGLRVLCLTVDGLGLPQPIRLAKIDAEGHELSVLRGMRSLLARDHPTLIVEANSTAVIDYLAEFGYSSERLEDSCNRIFRYSSSGIAVSPGAET